MKRPGRGRSLFWTIAAMFALAVVLGTIVQVLVVLAVLGPIEAREARARADAAASGIAAAIAAAPPGLPSAELDSLLARSRVGLGPRAPWIAFRANDGRLASAPAGRAAMLQRVLAGGALALGKAIELPREPGAPERLELMARRTVRAGGAVAGEVLIVRPMRPRGLPLPIEPRVSLLFLPLTLLLSAAFALFAVRMLVRRLRTVERFAARVAEGDLSARIGDTSGDEIGQLAARLDWMTGRLADARARIETNERERRQLLADITHELATPLTSIRGYAETLLDPAVPLDEAGRTRYVRGVVDEARRLDRLIRDLFELARLEAGGSPLVLERLNWAALARNVADRFEPRFEAAGVRLTWHETPEAAWIEADGHRLEQVLENLLVNALRYVPTGHHVDLRLARSPDDPQRFRLTVSDDGAGVPLAELPLLFERFHRGAGAVAGAGRPDAGGSGLGLAIVRDIVELHGGTVAALACMPSGLSIVIELPAGPPHA